MRSTTLFAIVLVLVSAVCSNTGARAEGPLFIRGDTNDDGNVNIGDAVLWLQIRVKGDGEFPCEDAADFDDDGQISELDFVSLVSHLFHDDVDPAPPFPEAGVDPTPDELGCRADFESFQWSLVNSSAPWQRRAGLQVVELRGRLYLMGGRTARPPMFPPVPGDSDIWSDVWVSDDDGATWDRVLDTDSPDSWPARAYFRAVTKGRFMYVLGGQNFVLEENPCPPFVPDCPPFVSRSDFFSDVWRSSDGVRWSRMTGDAGWAGRAGLSAVTHDGAIFVFGGSQNDDSAIVGGPPERIYFNDVWKSYNGRHWTRVTDAAPWAPRAGAIAAVKDGYIYLFGGEDGFTCEPLPFCEPPYFNDVWRTRDGASWELVTESAAWSARPGHQCVVLEDHFVLFGGFGLLGNPMDVWVSRDGASWRQVSDSPWSALDPGEIKYDFAALSVDVEGVGPSILTFGGDRETFDFTDPTNYLRLDNDVWRYSPPSD